MDKAKLTEALREHPLTKSLPDRRLERFAKAGDYEVYRDAEAIVTEGMPADAVYLILDGRAAVTRKEAGDRRLAELGGGEILGEMSLVETAARDEFHCEKGPALMVADLVNLHDIGMSESGGGFRFGAKSRHILRSCQGAVPNQFQRLDQHS